MAYIAGEGRTQGTLFPVTLDDLVPADHICRVIDAFVDGLAMSHLGFERAEAADTGRPGYNPRDLLKLYLYGYLNQIRSSRRLEAECQRNVELMWLLGRLYPDHKSIAEFRRLHIDAIAAAGAELVRFAREHGLIRGEWIAIDGSKFRAVASINATCERLELQRYLDKIEKADEEQQASIDQSEVQAALEKLKRHPEPGAKFMLVRQMALPAYNVQTAVDAEHAIIVAHSVTLDASDIAVLLRRENPAFTTQRVVTLECVIAPRYLAWLGRENGAGARTSTSLPIRFALAAADGRRRASRPFAIYISISTPTATPASLGSGRPMLFPCRPRSCLHRPASIRCSGGSMASTLSVRNRRSSCSPSPSAAIPPARIATVSFACRDF